MQGLQVFLREGRVIVKHLAILGVLILMELVLMTVVLKILGLSFLDPWVSPVIVFGTFVLYLRGRDLEGHAR